VSASAKSSQHLSRALNELTGHEGPLTPCQLQNVAAKLKGIRQSVDADDWAAAVQECRTDPHYQGIFGEPLFSTAKSDRRQYIDAAVSSDASLKGSARGPIAAWLAKQAPFMSMAVRDELLSRMITGVCNDANAAVYCAGSPAGELVSLTHDKTLRVWTNNAAAPFDLAYVPREADTLDATGLAEQVQDLFVRLKPGGRLVVSSFLAYCPMRAFMDVFLPWGLCYRRVSEMRQAAAGLPSTEVAYAATYIEVFQNIVFLEVKRKGGTPYGTTT
jgi:hypothetical protein